MTEGAPAIASHGGAFAAGNAVRNLGSKRALSFEAANEKDPSPPAMGEQFIESQWRLHAHVTPSPKKALSPLPAVPEVPKETKEAAAVAPPPSGVEAAATGVEEPPKDAEVEDIPCGYSPSTRKTESERSSSSKYDALYHQ